jgi:hypothetical protein
MNFTCMHTPNTLLLEVIRNLTTTGMKSCKNFIFWTYVQDNDPPMYTYIIQQMCKIVTTQDFSYGSNILKWIKYFNNS